MLPVVCALGFITNEINASLLINNKVNRYRFFTFYATTGAEKCNHQLVVATTGAFTLTSVDMSYYAIFQCARGFMVNINKVELYPNCIANTLHVHKGCMYAFTRTKDLWMNLLKCL